MRAVSAFLLVAISPAAAGAAGSNAVSADLFKNGVALIRREVVLPASGELRLDDVPPPLHGSFWVEGDARVEARLVEETASLPAASVALDAPRDLAGRRVVVHLKDGGRVAGVVAAEAPGTTRGGGSSGGTLVVDVSGGGRAWLSPDSIGWIESPEPPAEVRRPKRSLLLRDESGAGGVRVLTYLARGLSWAPAYRVDLGSPSELEIRQQAVIRNEAEPLEGAELRLITGYPGIEFDTVVSPLAPGIDWATFFAQLSNRREPGSGRRAILAQQAILSNATSSPGGGGPPPDAGEPTELHFRSIGRRTIPLGGAIAVDVASGRAPYERIVEWIVPDLRRPDGRTPEPWERGDEEDDNAWDAVRFANPLKAPMTTAPALVVSAGGIEGEQLAGYAAAGETTVLRINKALGVRTRSSEWEDPAPRQIVKLGSREMRKALLHGELLIRNQRGREAVVVVRRRFSGELVAADGKPAVTLREEGLDSANRRNELLWTIRIPAGDSKTLTYRYTALIPN